MMMRRLSASLVVLVAAAACATTPPPPVIVAKPEPPPAPGPTPPTIERSWRLAFLDGVQGPLSAGATLKLSPDAINGLSASGFSGCGDFAAAASHVGVAIKFEPITPAAAATCTPEARTMEGQFVSALGAARRLTIRGGYLVLIDEFNRDKAYFVPG